MSRPKSSPRKIDPTLLNLAEWATINTDNIAELERRRVERRVLALTMYVQLESLQAIKTATGFSRQHVHKLFNRALELAPDGKMYGFRACRLNKIIAGYHRRAPDRKFGEKRGHAGSFGMLLETRPGIERDLCVLVQKKQLDSPRIGYPGAWLKTEFLKICLENGVKRDSYPFTVKSEGLRAVKIWVAKWLELDAKRLVCRKYGAEAAKKFGSGEREPEIAYAPYQVWEFDGHRIDSIFRILLRDPCGVSVPHVLNRIWLLVVRDRGSKVIVGHNVVLAEAYSALDVLTCIQKAIVPWKPMELTIPGLEYPVDGGFPSGVLPQLSYALPNSMTYDNALAHGRDVESWVWSTLETKMGCNVFPGPLAVPNSRVIEGFFNIFERHGFHRVPGTTGSNKDDPKRKHPEKEAMGYNIAIEDVSQLIDVYMAELNARPDEGLAGRGPLNVLNFAVGSQNLLIKVVKEAERLNFSLTRKTYWRHVRGPLAKGYPLHVNYQGVAYSSPQLSAAATLEGKKMRIEVDENEISTLKLLNADGTQYGILSAVGRWGSTKHDLRLRKDIREITQSGKANLSDRKDPFSSYLRYKEEAARKGKRSAGNAVAHARFVTTGKMDLPERTEKPMPKRTHLLRDAEEMDLPGMLF